MPRVKNKCVRLSLSSSPFCFRPCSSMELEASRDDDLPWLIPCSSCSQADVQYVDDEEDSLMEPPWQQQPAATRARWQGSRSDLSMAVDGDTPPWVLASPTSSAVVSVQDDSSDDEPAEYCPRPPNYCPTCGALFRGPVCRCIQLTMAHPITRILAQGVLSPPASPPASTRTNRTNTPRTPQTQDSRMSRQPNVDQLAADACYELDEQDQPLCC